MKTIQVLKDGWIIGTNEDPEVVAGIPDVNNRYMAQSPSGKIFSGNKETIEKLLKNQSSEFKAWRAKSE
jgi:hypothetical protein